jgi:hypothetical protein
VSCIAYAIARANTAARPLSCVQPFMESRVARFVTEYADAVEAEGTG